MNIKFTTDNFPAADARCKCNNKPRRSATLNIFAGKARGRKSANFLILRVYISRARCESVVGWEFFLEGFLIEFFYIKCGGFLECEYRFSV